MAAITISHVSDQMQQILDPAHRPLSPVDFGARVRVKRFSYTATGDEAVDSIVELARFNKDVDILYGFIGWEDDFSLATGTIDVGYSPTRNPNDDNIDAFLDGADTTGPDLEAIPEDGTTGIRLSEPSSIVLKVLTAKLTAGKKLDGYVLYVENS